MEAQHAKPGDTIEITADYGTLGLRLVVVECPDNKKEGPNSRHIWVRMPNRSYPTFIRDSDYKIINLAKDSPSASGRDVGVDESLNRQLNDNLQDLFT